MLTSRFSGPSRLIRYFDWSAQGAVVTALMSALLMGASGGWTAEGAESASDVGAANKGEAGRISVYSARHYDTDEALFAAFEKATGIGVDIVEAGGDALLERLKSEGDNSPCDVLLTVDAGRLRAAEDAGLFQPVDSDVLNERIPQHLRHPDGLWFGFSTRARCIYVNREAVGSDRPQTYEDLADPKWKDRVLIRSSSNVYNQSLLASLVINLGAESAEAWAKGVVENMARKPQGGDTDQLRALAAGEGDVAVGNSYYFARLKASDKQEDQEVVSKIDIVFPNQDGRGAHVNVSGAGVVRGSDNVEAAVRFLEFLASREGQTRFAQQNYEFPVVEGVATDPIIEPWAGKRFDSTTPVAEFGRLGREAVEIMDRVGWR